MVLGLIHTTFGDFVERTYGVDTWAAVLRKAGFSHPLPEPWGPSCPYHDKIAYALIGATCEIVNATAYDAGRAFGRFFIKAVLEQGYGKLVSRLGRNFVDFLINLNTLHLNLSLGVPSFVPPDFRVHKVTDTSLELHYHSKRPGLSSWVVGICEAVAKDFFDIWVDFRLLRGRDDGSCDHEVWEVTYPPQTEYARNESAVSALAKAKVFVPEPNLFWHLHPFHLIIDKDLRMLQAGLGLRRILTSSDPGFHIGALVTDYVQITVPYVGWDFDVLASIHKSVVVLRTMSGLELKGAFYLTHMPDGAPVLLFVGSPRVMDLDELEMHDMYISDIPAHDMSSDFVVMAEKHKLEAELTKKLEDDKRELEKAASKLQKNVDDATHAVSKLKESLATALATRDERNGRDAIPDFVTDTPAEKTLKFVDRLLQGQQVDSRELMELRDAIMGAGSDMRTPIRLLERMKSFNVKNNDVHRSLMMMLSLEEKDDEVSDTEPALNEDAIINNRRSSSVQFAEIAALQACDSMGKGRSSSPGRTGSSSPVQPDSPRCPRGGMRRRVARHRSSILMASNMPDNVLSILRGPSERLISVLSKIDDWQFDSFELNEVTNGWPLSSLAFAIMKKYELVPGRNQISDVRLARFLCSIEEGYLDNPYHCRIHAADVVRTMYVMMTKGGVLQSAWGVEHQDLGLLLALFAAVVHDYNHRGLNNDYLIKTSDPLALLYNDHSPMENHHLAAAFSMMREDSFNFLRNMPQKARAAFRKQVIDMVLATDMKQHFSQTSLFNTKFADVISPPAVSRESSGGKLNTTSSLDEDMRTLVLQMALKCADLGHLASPKAVHYQWVKRLEEEFFRQGDNEALADLPVSPLMDRKKEGVSKSQPGFFTIVVLPQFQSFCKVFPGCTPMLAFIKENAAMWLDDAKINKSRP